jgi:hypothetical protein
MATVLYVVPENLMYVATVLYTYIVSKTLFCIFSSVYSETWDTGKSSSQSPAMIGHTLTKLAQSYWFTNDQASLIWLPACL